MGGEDDDLVTHQRGRLKVPGEDLMGPALTEFSHATAEHIQEAWLDEGAGVQDGLGIQRMLMGRRMLAVLDS